MKESLELKKKDFQSFLDSLAKINDSAIVDITEDSICGIVTSEDSSLFLWATMVGDFETSTVLNLPSLRKLSKALDVVSDSTVKLKLNRNNLEYKGKDVKFKYHLFDTGVLTRPKLSLKKIKSFTYDVQLDVTKQFISNILKQSSIFKDTNKLYIYTEDGSLCWSLKDNAVDNTDVYTVLSDCEDGFILSPIILNLDNVRLLTMGVDDDMVLNINTELGIVNFEIKQEGLVLNYIASSLTT